jgi:NarL family two-component system response regulator LiaR
MDTVSPIRVMVVDEHDRVRQGLRAVLKLFRDLELVGEARDGREAIQVCEQLQPDVVLMDLLMPVMDGMTATRIIRQQWPQVQVIALTASLDRGSVKAALEAGAIGYLIKNVSMDDLAKAIRSAHAGESTISPEVMQAFGRSGDEEA